MIRAIFAGAISVLLIAALTACDSKPKQEAKQEAEQIPAQAAQVQAEAQPLTGFGVADWGMDRNDIIAAEGEPGAVGDTDGHLAYYDRQVMGKKAALVYMFENGCSALKSSTCKFADGYYAFNDGSREYSDELEKALTEKYGPPSSVNEEIEKISHLDDKVRHEIKSTTYVRRVGKVRIEHTNTFNLYDYTAYGTLYKSGPLRNFVHYYGPYHYEAEMNKKKAEERGLSF